MKSRLLLLIFVLGIVDSIYLTIVHYLPGALVCPTTGIINCENVLTSSFSTIFGIPLAVLGLAWFIGNLIIFFYKPNKIIRNIWLILGAGGIIYSITGQTILKKVCVYCLFLDFLIALTLLFYIYNDYKKSVV